MSANGGTRAHTLSKFYLSGFVAPASITRRDPFLWIGSIKTGEITKRSPKNVSITRGLYDGRGGFVEPGATIEAHLAKIESAASTAIRKLANTPLDSNAFIAPEIWRFLSWQAARTPGWMKLEEEWANELPAGLDPEVVEPPPPGFETIGGRDRPMCVENPHTGERREVVGENELNAYRKKGWKWILRREDHLELLHMQAWYFQIRHFPRFSWTRLTAPGLDAFITIGAYHGWLTATRIRPQPRSDTQLPSLWRLSQKRSPW